MVRQRQPCEHRGPPPEASPAQQQHVQVPLDREDQQQQEAQPHGLDAEVPRQADADEEPHQQQVLHRQQAAGQLGGGRVSGQQQADDQRAEVALEVECREQGVARHQGDEDPEERLHLAVAQPAPERADRSRRGHQEHEQECPRAGRLLRRGADEDHRRDVLQDQDADGETAVERLALAALLQRLDHQDRAGEGHREGQHRQRLEVLVAEQPQPECAEGPHEREHQAHRCEQVDPCRQPGLTPHQDPHVDLQPDAEQQQRDPEIGQHIQLRQRLDPRDVEDEPGGQEADQRRQAQQPGRSTAHEDCRQVHRHQFHGAPQAR